MVSGQELGGDSGKIDLILCDQIVIKHSREKKESEVKLKWVEIIFEGAGLFFLYLSFQKFYVTKNGNKITVSNTSDIDGKLRNIQDITRTSGKGNPDLPSICSNHWPPI